MDLTVSYVDNGTAIVLWGGICQTSDSRIKTGFRVFFLNPQFANNISYVWRCEILEHDLYASSVIRAEIFHFFSKLSNLLQTAY